MKLPLGIKYTEVVCNPHLAFKDPELCQSKSMKNPLGLPLVYSGGFTTTFRLSNGNQEWAVRCFTKEIPELKKIYGTIERFTVNHPSDYLVPANYLDDGIKVDNIFYPIIKMKWVKGLTLNQYISTNLNNPTKISKLAEEFQKMINWLENNEIAHGDLQHGNIIVNNGKLILVDYDSIYLPAISNLKCNNLGFEGYKHPDRKNSQYNMLIDRFPSIVIYLGIKAIALSPKLWTKSYNNGENILFNQSDFLSPRDSLLLKEIEKIPQLTNLVKNFKNICNCTFDEVPTLDNFLLDKIGYIGSHNVRATQSFKQSSYDILDAKDKNTLLKNVGLKVTVIGFLNEATMGKTYFKQPYVFLNFGKYPNHTFTVVLWKKMLDKLKENNIDYTQYVNKWVSITGVISLYNEKPQMALDDIYHVKKFSNEQEAKISLGIEIPLQLNKEKAMSRNELDISRKLYGAYQSPPVQKTYTQPSTTYQSPPVQKTYTQPSTTYQSPPVQKTSQIKKEVYYVMGVLLLLSLFWPGFLILFFLLLVVLFLYVLYTKILEEYNK